MCRTPRVRLAPRDGIRRIEVTNHRILDVLECLLGRSPSDVVLDSAALCDQERDRKGIAGRSESGNLRGQLAGLGRSFTVDQGGNRAAESPVVVQNVLNAIADHGRPTEWHDQNLGVFAKHAQPLSYGTDIVWPFDEQHALHPDHGVGTMLKSTERFDGDRRIL